MHELIIKQQTQARQQPCRFRFPKITNSALRTDKGFQNSLHVCKDTNQMPRTFSCENTSTMEKIEAPGQNV